MPNYPSDEENAELYPDEGYAIVILDEFKPPDSDDFINVLTTFDSAEDVVLPRDKPGYSYYIYSADGKEYTLDDWPPDD